MKLFLVRHGETDWNVNQLFQGQTDVPLNENGLSQAEDLAFKLKDEGFDAIFSSDLQRALATATIINGYHDLKIQETKLLREKNFGEMEGKLREEVEKAHPQYFLQEGGVSLDYVIPGGESWNAVYSRVKKFFAALKKQDYKQVLLVAHGGVIRSYFHLIKGLSKAEIREIPMPNCAVFEETL
ncbi:MAG: histidine phosphatase family protein [Candidatus Gracilibacteria bacterium]|nr:histidine phosphatase family protein [Candidatus Gracilibacteria bacterium]